MKLHTNPGNLQSLKLLIAANVSKCQLKVVQHKHTDKVVPYLSSSILPVLEVYDDKFIFSPNAAARYILNLKQEEEDPVIDKWLEWDSSQLQPVLLPYLVSAICHNKTDASLQTQLQSLLKFLNIELKGKQRLTKDNLSVADIVVWCSLCPVLSSKGVLQGWQSQYPNIKSWFLSLQDQQEFSGAMTSVMNNGDLSCLKESLLAQPLPLPPVDGPTKLPELDKKKPQATKCDKTETTTEEAPVIEKDVTPEELASAERSWASGKSKCPKPRERKHPILPKDGERNLLITSALPYVNNVPHLGNIIGCVLSADVFSRYCQLRNYNCLYVCGTDEYGTATETKAVEEGLTPQQICDKYNVIHKDIYQWFNIAFDYFGRTTTPQQTEIAQDIFWKLYDKGYILKDSVDQLMCEKCNRFLADRFVEGICPLCGFDDARGDQCDACGKLINAVELKEPKCKLCKSTPIVKTSQHLFLDLPKTEPQLSAHLKSVYESGTWTNNAKVITNSWIRDGLKPRCISRDLKWGTPVPLEGYTDKVFYVWFDAPIGYISITANYTDQWKTWWNNPKKVEMYNFLGKDNVPFHSVIFPCTLLGAENNFTIVNHMVATEYLNYEDGKFSKSRGTGVFGHQAKDTGIPADIFRFYLLYVRPESQDSSFSWDDFLLKNNSELLNNLGNFINRALMFLSKNFAGVIQEMALQEEDKQLLALVNREVQIYINNMEQAKLRDSIRNILSISRLGNQYMQVNKPWVLVKEEGAKKSRAGTVVSLSANIACLLSVLIQPYMPATSATVQSQLNAPPNCNVIHPDVVCHLPPGHKIGTPSPLFEKIDPGKIEDLKKKFQGKSAPQKSDGTKGSGALSEEEVKKITEQITQQGNLVRELKAKKADKAEIDTQVKKLLELKKLLPSIPGPNSNASKGGGKSKGKKETTKQAPADSSSTTASTTSSTTSSTTANSSGPVNQQEVDRLTEEVAKQGIVVRELKEKKASKQDVDDGVKKLLDLKRQLAVAQGQDPDALIGGGKKKGKKK